MARHIADEEMMMFGKLDYPETRADDTGDDFFGTAVADPYRWLEQAEHPQVLAWTNAQHNLAAAILSSLPGRETFERRLREVWDYPKHGLPRKRGSRLFFLRNAGLQAQPILYAQENGQARPLLDPNALSDDGTVAIVDWQPSPDGRLMMVALSESGLDWVTFRVLDVDSGDYLNDRLEKIKFSSAAWRADGSGFFYSRFAKGADNQDATHRVYFHQLGTEQSEDALIYHDPQRAGITIAAELSADDRYIILFIDWESKVANRLLYRAIDDEGEFIPLFDDLDAKYIFVGSDEDTFYIMTTKDAPNWRVVAVNLNNPARANWRDVVPEAEDAIAGVSLVNHQFVVTYLHHARHVIKRYSKDGLFAGEVPLPELGATVERAGAYAAPDDDSMFIAFTSFLRPPEILRYNFTNGATETLFTAQAPSFDVSQYETTQVFYESADGTSVPMFITAKKGLPLDGRSPAILYAYGGYNISQTPSYRSWLPLWLENGGIFAVANIRGGGEYGEAWHRAGMFAGRQKTFDDFIAAAECLIDNGYTSPDKLAIEGASNGGLLVAVCMLQRPELYGAVLCHVPTIDMLRFKHFTAGRYWTNEYGDAESSKEHFDFLYAYGPLHNIQAGRDYPPILILTADHDDRVVPMHSKKLAASLQAADESGNVILLRVESKAGHGMGKPTAKLIEAQVDIFAFLNSIFAMGVD